MEKAGNWGCPDSRMPSKKGHEFMCHIKFRNTLPDPPVDYKVIHIPPDLSSIIPYRSTVLEKEYKYRVPVDLMPTKLVDFVDLNAFKPDMNELLPVEDEPLLVPFEQLDRKRKAAASEKDAKASKAATGPSLKDPISRRPDVTWLRRTEYISSENIKAVPSSKGPEQQQTVKRTAPQSKDDKLDSLATKEDLMEWIEESFEAVPLEDLVHPTNPSLRAVKSYAINIGPQTSADNSLTQCLFDIDPKATMGLGEVPVIPDSDSSAIIRAMSNPNDPTDSFVWYYLKEAKSANAMDEDTSTSYAYVRDYDIQRNERFGGSLHTLLINRNDAGSDATCKLVPIHTQFQLKRRRLKANEQARQPHILNVARR